MTTLHQNPDGSSCVLSKNGVYRYSLGRRWGKLGPIIGFFGVNPSKATHDVEDLTAMKWKGFSMGLGASGYLAGNAFAYRATVVDELRSLSLSRAIGPDNDEELAEIIRRSDILIPCWGSRYKLPVSLCHRLDDLADMLFASGKPVRCFGTTKSGDPAHPARLAYATPIVDWTRP